MQQQPFSSSDPPTRPSLFPHVPPFLNYLPGGSGGDGGPEHLDTMVELRECLWRIPMAFNHLIEQGENKRNERVRDKMLFICLSSIPKYY